ncbi:hypothetical protein [Planctomicrobium piriforme]|uniref:hypothetical protein n=1 Tax=Planctomicrobium piriforme TaxID=1576369 RepID=UPI001FEC3DE3|nr:hypothetical protein [Planctomicrobium piriforme]
MHQLIEPKSRFPESMQNVLPRLHCFEADNIGRCIEHLLKLRFSNWSPFHRFLFRRFDLSYLRCLVQPALQKRPVQRCQNTVHVSANSVRRSGTLPAAMRSGQKLSLQLLQRTGLRHVTQFLGLEDPFGEIESAF